MNIKQLIPFISGEFNNYITMEEVNHYCEMVPGFRQTLCELLNITHIELVRVIQAGELDRKKTIQLLTNAH